MTTTFKVKGKDDEVVDKIEFFVTEESGNIYLRASKNGAAAWWLLRIEPTDDGLGRIQIADGITSSLNMQRTALRDRAMVVDQHGRELT